MGTPRVGPSTARSAQVEARRLRVSELYLSGKSQYEIAAILTPEFPTPSGKPISQQLVANDLKCIRIEWRSSSVRNFDDARAQELARIDQVEHDAWQGWLRSVGKVKRIQHENGVGAQGAINKTTETTEFKAGDPRFLGIVQDCIKQRCEILGLNSARKLELDDKRDPKNRTDAELLSIIAGVNQTLQTGIFLPGNNGHNGNGHNGSNGNGNGKAH